MSDKILEYMSPLGVSTNHYNNYRVIKNGNKSFVQAYPSAEYVQYKKDFIPYLKKMVEKFEWEMINEFKHYYLDLVIYFDSKSKDPTNYFKVLQDVATGILWYDDKIILGRVNRVYYTYNPNCEPKIECKLYPTHYSNYGIFNDEDEYKDFIDKCKNCKSYKDGNCKKLSEYMEYKITKYFNIDNRYCEKFKEIKI